MIHEYARTFELWSGRRFPKWVVGPLFHPYQNSPLSKVAIIGAKCHHRLVPANCFVALVFFPCRPFPRASPDLRPWMLDADHCATSDFGDLALNIRRIAF